MLLIEMKENMFDPVDKEEYWTERYLSGLTGWDMGSVSPPLKAYFDQLADRELRVLIPGAGNGHEVDYLFHQGFKNVFLLDIARPPLEDFTRKVPDFPVRQIIHGNFFEHEGQYDLIVEQTFFCAFEPTARRRQAYADKVWELLRPGGKLMGLWWKFPLEAGQRTPPFGGSREEYVGYFKEKFTLLHFEDCYNSIKPRAGREFFGLLKRK